MSCTLYIFLAEKLDITVIDVIVGASIGIVLIFISAYGTAWTIKKYNREQTDKKIKHEIKNVEKRFDDKLEAHEKENNKEFRYMGEKVEESLSIIEIVRDQTAQIYDHLLNKGGK